VTLPSAFRSVPVGAWRHGERVAGAREVAEETAVAITYGRATYAVMLATPADLADFALGFSLNEGVVRTAADILECEILPRQAGIELRMGLVAACGDGVMRRRRYLAGATGCGLCGMESLAEAARMPPPVPANGLRWRAADLAAIPAAVAARQRLNRATHATHAAAFWTLEAGVVALREDVGRHNALDKLAGALARAGVPAGGGVVAVTSRVSVEMVQKAAMMGAPVMMAVSAPTALALRTAEQAGITVIGVARDDGFEVFTHPARVTGENADLRSRAGEGSPAIITSLP
jgi:FdhD protein